MIPNICINGSEGHAATAIKFLESLGGRNICGHEGNAGTEFYYVDAEGVIRCISVLKGSEITIEQAQDILDYKATLNEDGTVISYKDVCIMGNKEYPETIFKFFERIGCKKNDCACDVGRYFYFINEDGAVDYSHYRPQGKRLITLEEAMDFLYFGNAALDGSVVYSKTDKFPRMMWVWDDFVIDAVEKEVHGHVPTLEYSWIDEFYDTWKNASDTDPRKS